MEMHFKNGKNIFDFCSLWHLIVFTMAPLANSLHIFRTPFYESISWKLLVEGLYYDSTYQVLFCTEFKNSALLKISKNPGKTLAVSAEV